MDDWHRVISESLDRHPTVTKHLREVEKTAAMTALPSVEPLPPGTRPTEPGWYVTDIQGIVEVTHGSYQDRTLFVAGVLWSTAVALTACPDLRFIARIYPDRIGQ